MNQSINKFVMADIGGISLMRGINLFLTVLILIVPLASTGNEEQSAAQKFQQYKQDTVIPIQSESLNDYYYNVFPFMNPWNYGFPIYGGHYRYGHYEHRERGHHSGGFIMPAPIDYNNNAYDIYLKDIPKDTLVDPKQYMFLNREN